MSVKVRLGSFMVLSRIMERKSQELRKKISFYVSDYWQEQVMSTNRLSDKGKLRYIMNIETYKEPKVGAYIADKIAILLEKGWGKFDMKPGLLKGLKSRVIPLKRLGGGTDFRVVREESSGWIHPGYGGGHVVHRVKRDIPKIIKGLYEQATKGYKE
jgi:hypothetical protein